MMAIVQSQKGKRGPVACQVQQAQEREAASGRTVDSTAGSNAREKPVVPEDGRKTKSPVREKLVLKGRSERTPTRTRAAAGWDSDSTAVTMRACAREAALHQKSAAKGALAPATLR